MQFLYISPFKDLYHQQPIQLSTKKHNLKCKISEEIKLMMPKQQWKHEQLLRKLWNIQNEQIISD